MSITERMRLAYLDEATELEELAELALAENNGGVAFVLVQVAEERRELAKMLEALTLSV